MKLILSLLLTQPPAPVMDAVTWPTTDAMIVAATCPQGVIRLEIVRFPSRARPRVTELSLAGMRLPAAQTNLIDDALGGALLDTIYVQECARPPDDRIRIQVRVQRTYSATETRTEFVTFFVKGNTVSIAP